MQQHSRNFTQRGIYAADRAFNNLKPERLQLPLRADRWEAAFDYRSDQLGHQTPLHGRPVIMVDGALYVHFMPENLRNFTRHHANSLPDPETGAPYTQERLAALMQSREPYRLKAHGRADADGYQRFTYPDPRRYMAYDPATGKRVRNNTLTGSVTVPPQPDIVKHLQKYPWQSPDWHRVYGQRNQVESANKHLKDVRYTDLAQPKKRSARGYAFQFLTAALMCVSSNIRRLVTALREEFSPKRTPATRARRRTDPDGTPLDVSSVPMRTLAPPG